MCSRPIFIAGANDEADQQEQRNQWPGLLRLRDRAFFEKRQVFPGLRSEASLVVTAP